MFFDNFLALCEKKGVSPSHAATDMGMNRSIVTFWKNGTTPKMDTLSKIAEYFGVSVGTLVDGYNDKEKMPTLDGGQSVELTPAFFRLKQGLEPYDISESDVDFLLDVYRAHVKKNQ